MGEKLTKLTTEEKDEIERLLDQGLTQREIALRTGRSLSSIRRVMQERGILSVRPRADTTVRDMLRNKWHWKIPESKPAKRKSYFVTPYNAEARRRND